MGNRLAALVFVSLMTAACAGGSKDPAGSSGGAMGSSGGGTGSGGGMGSSGGGTGSSGGRTGSSGGGTGSSGGATGSSGGAGGSVAWSCVETPDLCFCNTGNDDGGVARCVLQWPCCFAGSATSCECADQATCDFAKALHPDARIVPTCPPP